MSFKSVFALPLAMAATWLATLGCRTHDGILGVDRCATIPAAAIPAAPGHHVCEWQKAQVNAAAADLGVFYQADFVGTSEVLGPAARKQIDRLVQQQMIGRVPIIVEPTTDPMQNLARQHSVAAAFMAAGVPMTAEQVLLAYPPALGLDAFRAQQVAGAAVRSGRNGSQGGSGGAGMAGGTSGGFGGGLGMGSGGIF